MSSSTFCYPKPTSSLECCFYCWVSWASYIFWVLINQTYRLQIFSPVFLAAPSLCSIFALLCRSILGWYNPICQFFLCWLCLWDRIREIVAYADISQCFPCVLLQKFSGFGLRLDPLWVDFCVRCKVGILILLSTEIWFSQHHLLRDFPFIRNWF